MEAADAHVHFFRQGYRTRYGVLFPKERELALYKALRKAHGIGQVLAVGYEQGAHRGNNRYLGEIAARHRWVYPLAYRAADRPPKAEELARYWRDRFVGLSLYVPDPKAARTVAGWPSGVFAALNERRALVSLNVPCIHLSLLRPFLEKLEGCHLLISHLGLPGRLERSETAGRLRDLTALASLPRLGIKASAFYACGAPASAFPHSAAHPVFNEILARFGPDRLYWGSDFSPALEHVSFAQTLEVLDHLNLEEDHRKAILGGNLRALLKSLPRKP